MTANPTLASTLDHFGEVILPEERPIKGFVVFFPPASGDKGQQKSEAQNLSSLGIASLLYVPPYRRPNSAGGPANIEGELKNWNDARSEYKEIIGIAQSDLGVSIEKNVVVGKNLGGSVGAFASLGITRCFIATGSVAQLSRFWSESNHPVAQEFRKNFSPQQMFEYRKAMTPFDLTVSLRNPPASSLVQFGSQDNWIEKIDVNALTDVIASRAEIQWTDDDHSMNSDQSRAQRFEFVKNCLAVK